MNDLTTALARVPVIGILRGCPPEHVSAVAATAQEAGLTALEVTLNSERPFDAIRILAEAHPDLSIGAGTVRLASQVTQAVEAGARFIVSPQLDTQVIAAAAVAGVTSVPGAATPTEIWEATQEGADLVKVFPARELGGPAYVKAVLGPLGSPALVPTGGVDASNAAAFLEAGSTALGVGGALFPRDALESGDTVEVGRRCRSLMAEIQ